VIPDGTNVGATHARTTILLEPRLANLRYAGGFRMFQKMSVKDIVTALLSPERIDAVWRARPEPPVRDYRTQADESDLDFLRRLVADEGLHFFFEHTKDKTTIVFTNDPKGFLDLEGKASFDFRDTEGAVAGEHVRSVQRAQRVRTGAVEHRDYDFQSPRTTLKGRAETSNDGESNTTRREWREYPGGFLDPDAEGTPRGKMRLNELRSDAFVLMGTVSTLRLAPGRQFSVTGHRDGAFNRKLVATEITLRAEIEGTLFERTGQTRGSRAEPSLARFVATPADAPIRPTRRPKPPSRLRTARVVGPADGDPHVDEFGRIKVQFAWDRDGGFDEHSSCWIRMMTPVAHGDEGFWSAHKVGSEVLVDFLDGDIDRPIVLGAVYNGKEQQPYKQPGKVSRSSWKIRGVPGGSGYNEITFECSSGSEQIILHAQKDLNETILNDHNEDIGKNQTSKVGTNQKITVGTDRSLEVGNNEKIKIGVDQTIDIGANQSSTVGANRTARVAADESLTVMGSATKKVLVTDTVLVGAARSLTAASEAVTVGTRTKTVATDETTSVGGGRSESVGGAESVTIGGQRDVSVGDNDSLAVEKKLGITAKEEFQLQVGDDAMISLKKDGDILLKTGDATLLMKKSGEIELKGKKILIQADSDLTIKGGNVVVKGDKVAVN
jgi:type VI secretion system secreted protein VgrG